MLFNSKTNITTTISGNIKVTTETIKNPSYNNNVSFTPKSGYTLFKNCFPVPEFSTYYVWDGGTNQWSGSGVEAIKPIIKDNSITYPSRLIYMSGLVTTPYYYMYVSSITVYYIDVV